MKDRPFIHLFETYGGQYVYDVNTNLIVKVDPSVYAFLQAHIHEPEQLANHPVTAKMIRDGLLQGNGIEEIVHPADHIIAYQLQNNLQMMTIQVTQRCNLNCKYCSYSSNYENRTHSQLEMDFPLAKKGMDFIIDHSKDSPHIHFGFYGGEPLLNFELIQQCVAYAEKTAVGKKLTFGMTTNATLLNPKIVAFLQEHDFNLIISLDGPAEIHNANRVYAAGTRGTFEIVMENLEMVKEQFPAYFPKVRFNAVVDPMLDFSCTNTFFATYDMVKASHIQFAFIADRYRKNRVQYSSDQLSTFRYETFKLFLSKLNRLDPTLVSRMLERHYLTLKSKYHDQRVISKCLTPKMHHGGPCTPGVLRLFMNVHGEFYPCERVSEASEMARIGHIDTGFDLEKVKQVLNIGKLTEDSCKHCWAIRFCTLCVAAADNLTELSADKKRSECRLVRETVERNIKEYCTLREFGHRFDEKG